MQLSPNFTLAQLSFSETAIARGIDNRPPPPHVLHLRALAARLEEVRSLLGAPLRITSAYRSPALNAAVGGVPTSRHALGLAADFTCARFGSPLDVARAIADSGIDFDQLIHEYGRWVHFGLCAAGETPRRQLLTIRDAASGYQDGILPTTGPP